MDKPISIGLFLGLFVPGITLSIAFTYATLKSLSDDYFDMRKTQADLRDRIIMLESRQPVDPLTILRSPGPR